MTATFTKHQDKWVLRVAGTPEVGEIVTVARRDGQTRQVVVTEIIQTVSTGTLCEFTDEPDAPAPAAKRERTFSPTAEQLEALRIFMAGGPLVIQAGAGTGKTSSLILLAEAAHQAGRCGQYVAFNKDIVKDTGGKFPASVRCNTAHSLAYQAVGTPFKARMESGARMKSDQIARILRIEPVTVTRHDGSVKTLTPSFLAGHVTKAVMRFCQTADAEITYRHFPLIDNLDAAPSADRPTSYAVNNDVARQLVPAAQRAWSDLTQFQGDLPFTLSTAMSVYLKLWQLTGPKINADYILWDEAQDASPVMIDVIRQQTGAQIVAVGDSNQAIYGFTGAVDALSRFEEMTGSGTAMLTQSFRFGPAVAEVANEILSTLSTEMRLVGTVEIPSVVDAVLQPRAILTRTNATALRMVLSALANGQRPYLVGSTGGDVASFCRAALDLQAGRKTDHPEIGCFDSWGEVQEYVTHDQQGDDLRLMVNLIDEFTAQAILDAINSCSKEADADVIVSTAHKSKGREWDSVQVAGDFPEAAKMGDEERRLLYVAVTRARIELDITAVEFFNPTTEGPVA